ncbi:MAG: hypothetical protein ACI9FR_001962 [Cryomorphaceae bacterium]|jgi:hypothetical protein
MDVANGTVCITSLVSREDQRGLVRNSICDIGSFEVQEDSSVFFLPLANGKFAVFSL